MKRSPRGSALGRSLAGDDHIWGLPEQILAAIFDALAVGNWQRAGDENAKRPDQLPRPGVTRRSDGDVMARGKAVSVEEMNARLGWGNN